MSHHKIDRFIQSQKIFIEIELHFLHSTKLKQYLIYDMNPFVGQYYLHVLFILDFQEVLRLRNVGTNNGQLLLLGSLPFKVENVEIYCKQWVLGF